MLADFLYNECQNILSVLKQSDNLDQDVNNDILDAISKLRLACARLDERDPLPDIVDLRAVYEADLTSWLNRTISRSDGY